MFSFIYHVRAGDGECNCSSKHDISLSNPCVPFHMCVLVCLCVFPFALLYLLEKANRFSSLSLEPAGWTWMGAMLCNIEARKLYMCMLDGRRVMAFGALGDGRFYVYDFDGTCARMRWGGF